MHLNDTSRGRPAPSPPSMLDLIRLSPRRLFPPGGLDLYRQIAILTRMSEEDEVLDVACGKAVALEYFVREFGVQGSGVDADPGLIEAAETRSREMEMSDRLQFQSGPSDALPYRDAIFDIAIGEVGLASHASPEDAIRELVRVTKPGGSVVLVQLVWKAPVDPERQQVLSEHLGARPRMVVEWKRLLREAGVQDVHTEDWSDARTAFRSTVAKPFPDFAELFSFSEKIGIMRRAWRQWGWRGVRTVLARERAVHRLLTRERILGLDLLKGRKADDENESRQEHHAEEERRDLPQPPSERQHERDHVGSLATSREREESPGDHDGEEGAADTETEGLPLFGSGGEDRRDG